LKISVIYETKIPFNWFIAIKMCKKLKLWQKKQSYIKNYLCRQVYASYKAKMSLLRKVQFVDFHSIFARPTDVKDQHKNKGKRLKINKLKIPFRHVLTENVSGDLGGNDFSE